LLTGLFTIIIALYNSLILTCTSVFLLSFVITMDDIIYESIVMLLTDSRYRGRIKGLQVSIVVLLMPVAMLFGGYIGDLVGVRNLIIISSAFVFLATIICFANKHARSVYSRYEHTVNLFRYLYLESRIKRTKNFLTGSYHLFKRMLD
jgi:MFS transporter, DHA3 family, macrolide efflux protein